MLVVSKPSIRYSRAIFKFAEERELTDKIHSDFQQLRALARSSQVFENFLKNRMIPSTKRSEVITELFKGQLDPATVWILEFLNEKSKLPILEEIIECFMALYLDSRGKLPIEIISASKINDDEVSAICARMKEILHRDVQPDCRVDPLLVGGFKIIADDVSYDFSVRRQLLNFKRSVLNFH